MNEATQKKVQSWLQGNFDQDTKAEIKKTEAQNPSELEDAFYKNLEFGTGGLRGIMGVGTNRMNKYTVGMATQGYANYLKQVFPGRVAVAIAHATRYHCHFLAATPANLSPANDIKVYLFDDMRPTPEVSYAVRQLKCKH